MPICYCNCPCHDRPDAVMCGCFVPCCANPGLERASLPPRPPPPPTLPVPDDLVMSKADLVAALARKPETIRVSRGRLVFMEFVEGRVPGLLPGQGDGRTWKGNPAVAEYVMDDDMREEYDFTGGVRGKYVSRCAPDPKLHPPTAGLTDDAAP